VSMSSSWCCNPQFRLSVAGSGYVIVCLGQQDPQVGGQGCSSNKHTVCQLFCSCCMR
jgi:hypothetical protein